MRHAHALVPPARAVRVVTSQVETLPCGHQYTNKLTHKRRILQHAPGMMGHSGGMEEGGSLVATLAAPNIGRNQADLIQ